MAGKRTATMAVLLVLGLHLSGAQGRNHVVAGVQGQAVAQSQSTDENGVTTGECAFTDKQGQPIRIRYQQTPDGQIQANVIEGNVPDPVAALRVCRQSQSHLQDQLQAQQQHLQRQQENLFYQLRQQQQAIFNHQPAFPDFFN
ncbi:uncharacterized protein LOC121870856 [Homarus americanus]|uniref:Putative SP-like 3 n=1 Tax=Homarus americanus TaxID=6706 RepID=A0A8J5K0B5_HOMAM|nr:uncharacterized protein LOC121870856 [Homarus americanus]KAG7165168.1 putative SP-like 3 [Homarus americanus]